MTRTLLNTASALALSTLVIMGLPGASSAAGPSVYNVSSVEDLKGTSMWINADAETRHDLEQFVTTAINNPNAANNMTNSTYSLNVVKPTPATTNFTPATWDLNARKEVTTSGAAPKPSGATVKVGFGTMDSSGQIFDKRGTLVAKASPTGELLKPNGSPMSTEQQVALYKELHAVYTNAVTMDGKKLTDKEIANTLNAQVKSSQSKVVAAQKDADTKAATAYEMAHPAPQTVNVKAGSTIATITMPVSVNGSNPSMPLANGYTIDAHGSIHDAAGSSVAMLQVITYPGMPGTYYTLVDTTHNLPTGGFPVFDIATQKAMFTQMFGASSVHQTSNEVVVKRIALGGNGYFEITSTGRIFFVAAQTGKPVDLNAPFDATEILGTEWGHFNDKGEIVGKDGKPPISLNTILSALSGQMVDTSMHLVPQNPVVTLANGNSMQIAENNVGILHDSKGKVLGYYDLKSGEFTKAATWLSTGGYEYHSPSAAEQAKLKALVAGVDFSSYQNWKPKSELVDTKKLSQVAFAGLFPNGLTPAVSTPAAAKENPLPVVITLPASGTRKLANGYSIDREGFVRNPNGTTIGRVLENGNFLNAKGKPATDQESTTLLALVNTPVAVSATGVANVDNAGGSGSGSSGSAGTHRTTSAVASYSGEEGNKDRGDDVKKVREALKKASAVASGKGDTVALDGGGALVQGNTTTVANMEELHGSALYQNASAETKQTLDTFVTAALKDPKAANAYTNSDFAIKVSDHTPIKTTVAKAPDGPPKEFALPAGQTCPVGYAFMQVSNSCAPMCKSDYFADGCQLVTDASYNHPDYNDMVEFNGMRCPRTNVVYVNGTQACRTPDAEAGARIEAENAAATANWIKDSEAMLASKMAAAKAAGIPDGLLGEYQNMLLNDVGTARDPGPNSYWKTGTIPTPLSDKFLADALKKKADAGK